MAVFGNDSSGKAGRWGTAGGVAAGVGIGLAALFPFNLVIGGAILAGAGIGQYRQNAREKRAAAELRAKTDHERKLKEARALGQAVYSAGKMSAGPGLFHILEQSGKAPKVQTPQLGFDPKETAPGSNVRL